MMKHVFSLLLAVLALWSARAEAELPRDEAALKAEWARHDALEPGRLSGVSPQEPLEQAAAALGEPPGFWARVCLLPACSGRPSDRSAAIVHLTEATARVRARVVAEEARLSAMEAGLRASPNEAAIRARLAESRRALTERHAAFELVALRALAHLTEEAEGGVWPALKRELSEFLGQDASSDVALLLHDASTFAQAERSPILSAELTYVEPALIAPPLGDGGVIAAHAADTTELPAVEDTTAGREVELSPEVMTLGQSLATPKAAFDFVRTEVAVEWYFGARQGSTETLRTRRGNDADSAALLVALLRAQAVPARFVTGTIELPLSRVAAQLGLLTAADVALLDAPGPTPAPFVLTAQQRTLTQQALSAAGIPFVPITQAGVVNAVQLTHVWVEAFVAFEDYRGAGAGRADRQWIPLDAWFSGRARLAATPPSVDALTVLGQDAESLAQAWLAQSSPQSLAGFFRSSLSTALSLRGNGATLADAQYRVVAQPETLDLLPGSLPYKTIGVTEEGPFLPDSLTQSVQLLVADGAGAALDLTLPVHRLTGHRVILSYQPATALDEEIVSLAGGLYRAPASLVFVVPVLRIDGRELGRGTRSVGLGVPQSWSIVLRLPGGSVRRVDNRLLAGNAVAVGFAGPRNGWVEPAVQETADTEGPAGRFLYGRAAKYANEWGGAEEELASYLQVLPVRPTVSVVLVQNQLQLEQVLGQPASLVFKGLEIDADFRSMSSLELVPGRGKALRRLSGLEGSFREAQVLADGVGEEAVSSTRILQLAVEQGVPLLTLTQANQGSVLPQLQATAEVRQDVLDNLARGREVIIPTAPLTVRDWTGTGYIARNLSTEEAGYFLSGRLSGGATVVAPPFWADPSMADRLATPDAPAATMDLSLVTRILKLPGGDRQEGVVGKRLTRPVGVVVLTSDGRPVANAPVTFSPALGSITAARFSVGLFDPPLAMATVRTDYAGRAFAFVYPDTNISRDGRSGIQWPVAGQPNPELVTINDVQASVGIPTGTLVLEDPFLVMGHPDVPAKVLPRMNRMRDDGVGLTGGATGLELQEQLQVVVLDQYDNSIANAPVAWVSSPAGLFAAPGSNTARTLTSTDPSLAVARIGRTVTSGLSITAFIPGTVEGNYFVEARLGTLPPGRIEVLTGAGHAGTFQLRAHVPQSTLVLSGIKYSSYANPYVIELLRNAGTRELPNWQPVRGDEPDIVLARVTMRLTDDADKVLAEEVQSPLEALSGPRAPYDTSTNVVFWPKYLTDGGQRATFSAHINLSTGVNRQIDTDAVVHHVTAGNVEVEALSGTLAGGAQSGGSAPAPARCDAVASPEGLIFDVTTPTSWQLGYRLSAIPDVPGQQLLGPPGPMVPRHPLDPSLMLVSSNLRIYVPLNSGMSGGKVKLEILAPDFPFGPRPTQVVAEKIIRVTSTPFPATANNARVITRMVFPVRNPESIANPPPASIFPPTATEPPMIIPGRHVFCVPGEGYVQVSIGSTTIAEGNVVMTPTGPQVFPIPGGAGVPALLSDGTFLVIVQPQDASRTEIKTTFFPSLVGSPPQELLTPLEARIDDKGVLPVGHVFVKDVSVVDGHLVKQAADLAVTGRGPSIAFNRSYSSRSGGDGVLGPGWSHSLSVYAMEDTLGNVRRFLLVGGEGTGQMFSCDPAAPSCSPQRGYHGTMRIDDLGSGLGPELVYRSKGGVVYRLRRFQTTLQSTEWRVISAADSQGNTVSYEYGDAASDYALARVYQAGNDRFLEFSYVLVNGLQHLARVKLKRNPSAPALLAPGVFPLSLGPCLAFEYDAAGRLQAASRSDDDCQFPSGVVRREAYTYLDPLLLPDYRDNLRSYTDPDGVVTEYEYYTEADGLPGESNFAVLEHKEERVKAVSEPGCGSGTCKTTFSYSLSPAATPGAIIPSFNLYSTSVTGPRPGVPATEYWQDGYGATSLLVRPTTPGVVARSRVDWDPGHLVPTAEQDARARLTRSTPDDFGNISERSVATLALPATPGAPATAQVHDAAGGLVAEVPQRWVYDKAFARPTCEVDAEGRVTVHQLDSNNADPRLSPPVVGTGLLLRTTRYANPGNCSSLPLPSDDIVTSYRYCGVKDAAGLMPSCVVGSNGFKLGDLFETVDPLGNVTRVLSYDEFGLAKEVRSPPAGSPATQLVTTTLRDQLGRPIEISDTRGSVTQQTWDGLDRVACTAAKNHRGGSPGQLTSRAYYPSGKQRAEVRHKTGDCVSPGVPAYSRLVTLDARGRPERVTEAGVELAGAITTIFGYDEAGNRVSVTDGRGVKTTSGFDYADRPISTTVAVADLAKFSANGGEGAGTFATSTTGYDLVGNKVFDTDLHGFRTEYAIDSLYRVVLTRLPPVPGKDLVLSLANYETSRRYDLVGNVVREEDGNANATIKTYDFANRLTSAKDAVGRSEVSTWDANGNRRTQLQTVGAVVQSTRTFSYDALNRPIEVVEQFAAGGPTPYVRSTRYDDSALGHATATRDPRGFVTTTLLDDLGRAYTTVTDDGSSALLSRNPDDARAGQALNLTTRTEYDPLGNASAVVDARGLRTETTWDALGRAVARSLPLGVSESTTYNAAGAVVSSTDRRRVTRENKYDALGRETRSILVETMTSGGARLDVLTRTYFDAHDPTTGRWKIEETDAANSTTTRFMDAFGRVVTVEDPVRPSPNVTELRYDAKVQWRARDAKGYVTETITDAVYRPREVREFDVGATSPTYSRSTSYDDTARTETATDWRGTPTVLERDGLGRLLKRTRGSGTKLQVDVSSYNKGGQEVLHTDANGHLTEWVYDGAARKIRETKALGTPDVATWAYTYDEAGNQVEAKGPRTTGPVPDARTTWDGLNRAVRVEDAMNHVTFRAFDEAGNLVCEKTPLGVPAGYAHGAAPTTLADVNVAACETTHVTKYAYDEEGKLTKVTTALGSETTYVWDASRKRMLAKQDGNLQLTTYEYDERALRTAEYQHLDGHSRLTSRVAVPPLNPPTHAGSLAWLTTYDPNGNVRTQTDPLGQVATQVHGLRNRLDEVTYSLHTPPRTLPSVDSESWAYDENGNAEGVTQAKLTATPRGPAIVQETTTRSYDVLDRLETETRYDTKVTTYRYDAKGNRTRVTDFENVSTEYTFDAQDRLQTAVTAEGTTTYGYFPDGLLKSTAFFDQVTHEGRCYDDAGRLTGLVTARVAVGNACAPAPSTYLSRHQYIHDAEGNRLSQVEELTVAGGAAPGSAETTEYGYDDESRLVGVKYPDNTAALYQLDAVGNRVGERKAVASLVPALTAAAFLAVSPAALTNDVVAVFNRADLLESVTDSRAPAKDAKFEWDAAGNLTRQQTATRDRRFTWDVKQTLTKVEDNGIEAGRYDYGSDGLRSKRLTSLESVEYVLDGMQVLVETDGANNAHPAKRRYHYASAALAVTDISGATRTTKALHLDALGSPATETTQAGAVAAVRQYDAWGLYRNGTAPGSTDAKLGYTGHQYDPETGLVYARARYYDPEYGRFLSRDGVEGAFNSAPSLHRYGYARNSPLRYTDPTGHCFGQDMTCAEMWRDVVDPEPFGPPPATPLPAPPPPPVLAAPTTDESEENWKASQDEKARERRQYYLYAQEPPKLDKLLEWGQDKKAASREWERTRTRARQVEESIDATDRAARWYLREVAAPYLIAEGAGLGISKLGGAAANKVAADVALGNAARVAEIERYEAFRAAQKVAPTLPLRNAEFGHLEATAMASKEAPRRLVVGGGSAPGFPAHPSNAVTINPAPGALPSVVGVGQELPFANGVFDEVVVEALPYNELLGAKGRDLFNEAIRTTVPGGTISGHTGVNMQFGWLRRQLRLSGVENAEVFSTWTYTQSGAAVEGTGFRFTRPGEPTK